MLSAVSLQNIELKWYSEVNKFWQKSHEKDKAPLNFILIGTKSDARKDEAYIAKLKSEGKEIVPTEKVLLFLLFLLLYLGSRNGR